MKQLKFMLAAATAIGLASAAQAGYLYGSTDFESDTVGELFTSTDQDALADSAIVDGAATIQVNNKPFWFSETRAKKLQVNTGTAPILRSVNGSDDGESLTGGNIYIDTLVQFTPTVDAVDENDGDKLMVYLKEIVTEEEGEEPVKSYKLYAKGGYKGASDVLESKDYELNLGDKSILPKQWYRLTVKAHANVAAVSVYPAFEVFIDGVQAVIAGDKTVDLSESTGGLAANLVEFVVNNDANRVKLESGQLILSMVKGDSTLKSVGFAGEGEVDDLVISTFDASKTVVDFTLALADVPSEMGNVTYETPIENGTLDAEAKTVYCYSDNCTVTVDYTPVQNYTATWSVVGEGATAPTSNTFDPVKGAAYTLTFAASAPTSFDFTFTGDKLVSVTYTIDDGKETTANKDALITVEGKTSATVKVTAIKLDPLYVVDDNSATKVDVDYVVDDGDSLVVTAKALTGDTGATVPTGTTAADIGITAEAFSGDTGAALNAVVKWATTSGKGSLSDANAIKFDSDGNPAVEAGVTNLPAQAYLLNCAVDQNAIDKAKKEFTFPSINASDLATWVSNIGAAIKGAKDYNGTVKVYGAADLKDLKDSEVPADATVHKFFRAVLTK